MSSCKMEPSPIKLKLPAKSGEQSKSLDFEKCLICQKQTNDPLRKASTQGLSAYLKAVQSREETGDTEVVATI